MIDIVIPFYNDLDDKWRNVMLKYMKEEHSGDRQVTGEERYRDWDTFKYWFRCVEKNCSWVNKVFLIVAQESQVPDWMDTTNPKLRIVYHKEFIPQELLPTFNIMTIELFISRIKDLSDNYIFTNDDFFFLNPITPGMFFVDNYPVYRDNAEKIVKFGAYWLDGSDGTFYYILNNCIDMQLKISKDKANWYSIGHLPMAHKKDFENKILGEYYDDFINANNKSRFRCKDNLCTHVFVSLYKDLMPYYKFDNYHNSYYLSVNKDTDFNEHAHCDMICFNDTEQLSNKDFEETKNKMIKFFEERYPNKSLFEK